MKFWLNYVSNIFLGIFVLDVSKKLTFDNKYSIKNDEINKIVFNNH